MRCCSLLQNGDDYSIHWSARRCDRYRINKWGIARLFSLYSSTLIKSSVTRPTSNSVCCPCIDLCSYTEWSSRSWQEVRTIQYNSFFLILTDYLCRRHDYLSAANMSMTLLNPSRPVSKRRCLHWLGSSLLNCVNNRFDLASASALRRALRSHLLPESQQCLCDGGQSRICTHLLPCRLSECIFSVGLAARRRQQRDTAGSLNPQPSGLWSISLTAAAGSKWSVAKILYVVIRYTVARGCPKAYQSRPILQRQRRMWVECGFGQNVMYLDRWMVGFLLHGTVV